ncbi:hypothetical protein C1634_023025 [Chryseobacterium viscerum]|uniref:Uncharacterized protein n=1 Tax=Chryseobacterium viscerum TaxID=1037377 RepID=A0A316WB00_9FLAO|nr:hypothetical protein C1634_023025 [Chryseobacterium viscerum]
MPFVFDECYETTFFFWKRRNNIISFKNYITDHKGNKNMQLLEDCMVCKLNTKDLEAYFLKNCKGLDLIQSFLIKYKK